MKPENENTLAGKIPDGAKLLSQTLGSPAFKVPDSAPRHRRTSQRNKSSTSPSKGAPLTSVSRKRGRARSLAFASPPEPSTNAIQVSDGASPLRQASEPKTPADRATQRGAGVARSLCMDVAATTESDNEPHEPLHFASGALFSDLPSPTPMRRASCAELLANPTISGPSPKIRRWGHRVPSSPPEGAATEAVGSSPTLSLGSADPSPQKQPLREWSPVRVMRSLLPHASEGGNDAEGEEEAPVSVSVSVSVREGASSAPSPRVLMPRNEGGGSLALPPPPALVGAEVEAGDKENVHRMEIEKENVPRLDGPLLLASPSSLDLGRRPEWSDPVYRGMMFVGCHNQYTVAHYQRYLAKQQRKEREVDVEVDING